MARRSRPKAAPKVHGQANENKCTATEITDPTPPLSAVEVAEGAWRLALVVLAQLTIASRMTSGRDLAPFWVLDQLVLWSREISPDTLDELADSIEAEMAAVRSHAFGSAACQHR